MTDTANGGLSEAAAKPVGAKRGQDFNDMLGRSDPGRIGRRIAECQAKGAY